MKLLVINGPNINMLGIREKHIYGNRTFDDLLKCIETYCDEKGVDVECFQSNHEGAIIDKIQEAYFEKIDGIVINPAGYTHTSVAIADALKGVNIPYVEVHISNVDEREDFRKISFVKNAAVKTITGKGFEGYLEAIDVLKESIINNCGEKNKK